VAAGSHSAPRRVMARLWSSGWLRTMTRLFSRGLWGFGPSALRQVSAIGGSSEIPRAFAPTGKSAGGNRSLAVKMIARELPRNAFMETDTIANLYGYEFNRPHSVPGPYTEPRSDAQPDGVSSWAVNHTGAIMLWLICLSGAISTLPWSRRGDPSVPRLL
jgi:hypothetical protein